MTHQELLEKIRVFLVATELQSIDKDFLGTKFLRSLYSIVELHNLPKITGGGQVRKYCRECGFPYPCPTIQAIEKELA